MNSVTELELYNSTLIYKPTTNYYWRIFPFIYGVYYPIIYVNEDEVKSKSKIYYFNVLISGILHAWLYRTTVFYRILFYFM